MKPVVKGTALPVQERTMGCWNCISWSPERGEAYWKEARQVNLAKATRIALESRLGQNDQRVVNIRQFVNQLDHAIALSPPAFAACMKKDLPRDKPVGDLVAHAYLCTHWTGAQGASVAREGQKADKLPEELMEDVRDGKIKGGP